MTRSSHPIRIRAAMRGHQPTSQAAAGQLLYDALIAPYDQLPDAAASHLAGVILDLAEAVGPEPVLRLFVAIEHARSTTT